MSSNVTLILTSKHECCRIAENKADVSFAIDTWENVAADDRLDFGVDWDAMYRCLGDGSLRDSVKRDLRLAVTGQFLTECRGRKIGVLSPEDVAAISMELSLLSAASFKLQFFGLKRTFLGFDISSYDGEVTDAEWTRLEQCLIELKGFYVRASIGGKAVISVLSC